MSSSRASAERYQFTDEDRRRAGAATKRNRDARERAAREKQEELPAADDVIALLWRLARDLDAPAYARVRAAEQCANLITDRPPSREEKERSLRLLLGHNS